MGTKKPEEGEVFCRYITRKGKRIYPQKGKVFRFFVKKK